MTYATYADILTMDRETIYDLVVIQVSGANSITPDADRDDLYRALATVWYLLGAGTMDLGEFTVTSTPRGFDGTILQGKHVVAAFDMACG